MAEVVKKSRLLTGYLEARILHQYGYPKNTSSNYNNQRIPNGPGLTKKNEEKDSRKHVYVHIFTPSDLDQRGAQLSLSFSINITQVFNELMKRGVVVSCYI